MLKSVRLIRFFPGYRVNPRLSRSRLVFANLIVAAPTVVAAYGAMAATVFPINETRTHVAFDVASLGFGKTHGTFRSFSGQLALDLERPQRSGVHFVVAAASVTTGSDQLDSYIRDAFFDVERFPTMSFQSSGVRKLDEGMAEVTGGLTLHGVTRPIILRVAVGPTPGAQKSLSFVATATIRRSEFGMTAAVPLVSDDISIEVSTEAEGVE